MAANNSQEVSRDAELKWQQSGSKSGPDKLDKKLDKIGQAENHFFEVKHSTKLKVKSDSSPSEDLSFQKLSKQSRSILNYIYEDCIRNHSLETGPISLSELVDCSGGTRGSVKVTLQRLRDLNCIDRVDYKDGQSGWTRYKLSNKIYSEILSFKVSYKKIDLIPSDKIPENKKVNKWEVHQFYNQLDFSSTDDLFLSSEIHPNFLKNIIFDLDLNEIQNFIIRYSCWLKNSKIKNQIKNQLGYFCEKLKNYAMTGSSPILSAKTEDEISSERMSRLNELMQLADMDSTKNKEIAESNLARKAKFEDWKSKASQEEFFDLVKPKEFMPFGSIMYSKALESAFYERYPFVT